jgi:hypothetical protein
MFSLTLMSKGEKRCGLDATVGGLSRIVQSFRVAINAKGGDCWHVYRQSVLVIDGKNNNDDGMSTGKNNNSDDGMSTGKNNNNDGMITGRVCNQSSGGIVQSCTQSASVCQGRG